MSQFKFNLNAHSSRKIGFYMLAITVTGKELKNFIAALKKLRAEPQEPIVFTQDRFPKIITFRRNAKPRKKRGWSTVEETPDGYTPDGYKVRLFDDDLELLMEFFVDWLDHGLPETPGYSVPVKFQGDEIALYFTHDAPDDRTIKL
jgi:hypothetical protein